MLMVRYTPGYKKQLEDLAHHFGYRIRYGKGNFVSGSCVIKSSRTIVINKFIPLEAKIQCLADVISRMDQPQTLPAGPLRRVYEKVLGNT